MTEYKKENTALVVGLTAVVGKDRQISFQTGLPVDCAVSELHGLVDKLLKAVDRQDAKLTIELVNLSIKNEEEVIQKMLKDKDRIFQFKAAAHNRSGKKGDYTPSDRDVKELADLDGQLEQRRNKIKEYKATINLCISKLELSEQD